MITYDPGTMRTRLEIQQVSQTGHGDFGEPSPNTFARVADRWAKVEPLTGREFLLAAQVSAEISHRVTMRADSTTRGVTPKHRFKIKDTTRVLEIVMIRNVGELNDYVEALCVEQVA